METMMVAAKMENLQEIMEFVKFFLKAPVCSEQIQDQICIAIEEIFTNIVSYAYPEDTKGMVEVSCDVVQTETSRAIEILFKDWGKPYNPLRYPDPDFDIPFEKRRVGGLGIYMVKVFMDQVRYSFENGCNQLRLKKSF